VFSARQVIDLDRPLWLAGSVARLPVPRVEPTRPTPMNAPPACHHHCRVCLFFAVMILIQSAIEDLIQSAIEGLVQSAIEDLIQSALKI
jgi:hypothetical protein